MQPDGVGLPEGVEPPEDVERAALVPQDEALVPDALLPEIGAPEAIEIKPAREPFWGYLDLLLIIGFIFAGLIGIVGAAAVLMALIPELRDDPAPILLPLQLVFYAVIYVGFAVVFRLRYQAPVLASLGWRASWFRPWMAAVAGGALALVLGVLATLMHTPQVPSPFDKVVNSRFSLALFVLTAVAVAPFFEEMLFRGFIQPLLSRSFGVMAGVIATSVLFGALHAPEYSWAWQYALVVSLAGAVFGWVRVRTGSLMPGTIMHGTYNLVFVIGYLATTHLKLK